MTSEDLSFAATSQRKCTDIQKSGLEKQLDILVSAYGCEPHLRSEAGVGWGVATALAQYHRVWVLTDNAHEAAIEKELATNPRAGLRVSCYRLPKIVDSCLRSVAGRTCHYYLWQLGAARFALKLTRKVRFDVIQHITYVRYWQPNLLALLPIPFVFGPVGGGESIPASFRSTFPVHDRVKDIFRNLCCRVAECDPLVRLTIRLSAMTLATTPATAARLHALGGNEIGLMTESALSEIEIGTLALLSKTPGPQVRFISVGRLLHWNGFHLAIQSFARALPTGAEYWIVGDGPERFSLERQVRKLTLEHRVRFLGQLPKKEALQQLGLADVLIHPSLRDSGGYVCLEAMAARKPILCLDLGGPGQQVTSNTGVKIPTLSPNQVIEDMARAMERLAEDPELRRSMGEAGHKRVKEHYTCEHKIKRHLEYFGRVCSSGIVQSTAQMLPNVGNSRQACGNEEKRPRPGVVTHERANADPSRLENWEIFFPPRTRVVALPSWDRPRLLVPAISVAQRASASAFYPSFRGRGLRSLLRLKAVLAVGAECSAGDTPPLLKEFLADALPGARVRAVQVGIPGPARKCTLQLEEDSDSGRIVGYMKCAEYPLARKRLRHEFRLLSRLPPGVGPLPIKYGSVAGYDALVLSPVRGNPLRRTLAPFSQLRSFNRLLLGSQYYRFESHPWVQAHSCQSGEMAPLLKGLSHREWPVAIQHGDLAPWNLIESDNGRLAAVDWEYGLDAGFPGLDLAQYVLQVARLIYRWPPDRTREYAICQLMNGEYLDLTRREAAALVGLAAYQAYQNTAIEGYAPTDWVQLWRRAIWEEAI